jgi:hypothetical protein
MQPKHVVRKRVYTSFIHSFIYLFDRSTLVNSAIGYRTCQEPNDRQFNNTYTMYTRRELVARKE